MGAWGHEPWSNDTAADLCYRLESQPITQVIEAGLTSDDKCEQRIAAWLFAQIGRNYVYPCELREKHGKLAVQKLDAILSSDWPDDWKQPTLMQQMLKAEIKAVAKMANNDDCLVKRILDKIG